MLNVLEIKKLELSLKKYLYKIYFKIKYFFFLQQTTL